VRKIYKLNAGGWKNGMTNGMKKEEEDRKELEVLVLGCIALRGSTN